MPKSRRPNRRKQRQTRKMRGGLRPDEEEAVGNVVFAWFDVYSYLDGEAEIVEDPLLNQEAVSVLEGLCALRTLGPVEYAQFIGGGIAKIVTAARVAATAARRVPVTTASRGLAAASFPFSTTFAPQALPLPLGLPKTSQPFALEKVPNFSAFNQVTSRANLREQLEKLNLKRGESALEAVEANVTKAKKQIKNILLKIKRGEELEYVIEGDTVRKEILKVRSKWNKYSGALEELNIICEHSRCSNPMYPEELFQNLDSNMYGGARGTLQTFIRNFTGGRRGEHVVPVEGVVKSLIYGAYQHYYPTFNEMYSIALALKNVVRQEKKEINLLLDKLLSAAEEISGPNFEARVQQAYTNLEAGERELIDSIGSKRTNGARGLEAVHRYRIEGINQMSKEITESAAWKDSIYLPAFLEHLQGNFQVRAPKPASFTPSGKKFGDQRRHFSTSSRRPPADARLTLEEFEKLNTGPDLKSKVPKEVLEQLGLTAERIRIPILKEKVFKYLFAEDKLRGQMEHIQLAKVRYEIASAALTKNTPLIAQLRQVEAELMERVGASKPMTRLSAANASVSLSHNSTMMEEGAQISAEIMAADASRKASLESLVSSTSRNIESSSDKALIDEVLIKAEKPADPLAAAAASYATVAALSDKAFIGGSTLPTTLAAKIGDIKIAGLSESVVNDSNKKIKEAADNLYSEISGSGQAPVLTSKDADTEYARMAKPLPKIPEAENAMSLLEQVKSWTPYGQALKKLVTKMPVTKNNLAKIRYTAPVLLNERGAIKEYNHLIDEGLKVILVNAKNAEIQKLLDVFTPQRMFDFKTTMISLFSYSAIDATMIFNIILTHVIPKSNYHASQIDEFLLRIRVNPADAMVELEKLSLLRTAEVAKILSASEQAREKGMGWFASKGFYTLLFGVGGGSVLFLANYMNTPDMASFSAKVGNIKANASNALAKSPTYQSLAEAGREMRDKILVDVLKQTPPPAVMEKQAPSWSKSIMWSLGYNPEAAEDRRKFGELGNSVRDVAGKAAVTAVLAGAGAIGVAIVKGLLSR